MKRRKFSKILFFGATAVSTFSPLSAFAFKSKKKKKTLKPKSLKKGDSIGLIAPGSAVTETQFQEAILNIEKLGFKPVYTKNILAKHGYLAGKDQLRLDDLHQMFSNPKINGIWCIRGGYGCTRILQNIDYQIIKNNPKALIGYSDITALLQAIHLKTGLIGFHGPVAVSPLTDFNLDIFQKVLMNPSPQLELKNAMENRENAADNFQTKAIRQGAATGILTGGNLSLISALAGTPYEVSYKNKILFLEDVGEKPYRIDRMLTQLRQSGDLNQAAAIILGIFKGCKGDEDSLSLMETLNDRLGDLQIPVIYGMSIGHIDNQLTLPVGIKARLDTVSETITLLENAVE